MLFVCVVVRVASRCAVLACLVLLYYVLACWFVGLFACWRVGLVCWFVGLLVCLFVSSVLFAFAFCLALLNLCVSSIVGFFVF